MPGFALHRQLIYMIQEFSRHSDKSFFLDLEIPAIRQAMLLGACLPDLMSGTNPVGFHTGLVHYLNTGSFARHLVDLARTPVQQALAWGWVSHIIADTRIHPVINKHCEEVKFGRFIDGLSYADDPFLHVQVETGVDVYVWNAFANTRDMSYWASFHGGHVELLCKAFLRTYGLDLSKSRLGRNIFKGIRMARLAPWLMSAYARDWYDRRSNGAPLPLLAILRPISFLDGLGKHRLSRHAFAHLLKPSETLASDISSAITHCRKELVDIVRAGIGTLEDWNLDTGKLENESRAYPLYLRVKEEPI